MVNISFVHYIFHNLLALSDSKLFNYLPKELSWEPDDMVSSALEIIVRLIILFNFILENLHEVNPCHVFYPDFL